MVDRSKFSELLSQEGPSKTAWKDTNQRSGQGDASSTASSLSASEMLSSGALNSIGDIVRSSNPTCNDSYDIPINDGYLAMGTISLRSKTVDSSEPRLFMQSPTASEPYPNHWTIAAVRKGWIRVEETGSFELNRTKILKVFVLPEDVDRRSRGSMKDFRKVIKSLLRYLNRSVDAWLGKEVYADSHQAYQIPKMSQEESLFYIFNTLQSPSPNLGGFQTSASGYQAVSDVMSDVIHGLNTQLYPYQKRSIAAMIQREAEPAKILDPRKSVYKDIHGRSFYLDINDNVLLKNAPLYTEPRGGILAETMGYGKTLICIALILATRGHYPKVPEDRIDSVPFRPREKVGSLLAMAARRAKHEGVPWKAEFGALRDKGYQFDRCLDELDKYEREYAEPIFTPTTPDRRGKRDSANIVRICSATLIIVPPNLLVQWQQEITKHTNKDALDVLVVDSPTKEVPSWQALSRYDIVIMTKARFEQEYRDDDLNQGKSRRGEARYRSSLTDVRWLRVICDEGHGFAGSSSRTNAMAMLDKMFIERRWVVSGTPSSTLHGVEVGMSTTDSTSSTSISTNSSGELPSCRNDSLRAALQKRRTPGARDLEAKDLERLRLIVVNFLRLQPWANQRGSSDVANWKKYLTPSIDTDGTHRTSPALRDVLQALIIRHRIEDIDTDLTLPPLHNRTVYLEPSYHDKIAINMFFLVLTSNYVTSEREDEDYMFHPRNRKKLDQLINNLRQASFHWVGFSEHDIRETLRISNDYLNKNIDKISDADGMLLTEAIMNGERALADPSWKAFATLHEIGVYIKNFPLHARESWAIDRRADDPVLLGTVQAREAQRYVQGRSGKSGDDLLSAFAGAGVRAMNAAKARAEDEAKAQQTIKAKMVEGEKQQVGTVEEPKLKGHSVSASSPGRMLSSSSLATPRKRRRSSVSADSTLITPPASPSPLQSGPKPAPAQLSHNSLLTQTAIAGFTSSKLTYLVSRLLTLPPRTKSLVFYQHNNTAFFIAEALELLSIPFRIYANTLSVAQRNTYLADFNAPTSDIQVLLMDVRQASHGLHVACASYVCIVSPIWEASVESQAIKRAHRIGQTREVVVETLVLKDTFEQEMVQRRRWKEENLDPTESADAGEQQLSVGETTKVDILSAGKKGAKAAAGVRKMGKSLLDDRHMVNVIKDIRFLKFHRDEREVGGRVKDMSDVPLDRRLLFMDTTPVTDCDGAHVKVDNTVPAAMDCSDLGMGFGTGVKQGDPSARLKRVRVDGGARLKKG